jgi:hypothetical protein
MAYRRRPSNSGLANSSAAGQAVAPLVRTHPIRDHVGHRAGRAPAGSHGRAPGQPVPPERPGRTGRDQRGAAVVAGRPAGCSGPGWWRSLAAAGGIADSPAAGVTPSAPGDPAPVTAARGCTWTSLFLITHTILLYATARTSAASLSRTRPSLRPPGIRARRAARLSCDGRSSRDAGRSCRPRGGPRQRHRGCGPRRGGSWGPRRSLKRSPRLRRCGPARRSR